MAEDKLTFLDEVSEDVTEDTPEVEEVSAQAEEPAEAPVEEVETEETGEETPPPGEPKETEQRVPVSALKDEREKRQSLEQEVARIKAMLEQKQAQQPKPDFFQNPDAAIDQRLAEVRVQQSRFMAEREFGADTLKEVDAYFSTRPLEESQRFLNHPSPYHAAVEAWKKQTLLDKMGSDPDAFIEQEIQRRLQEAQTKAVQTPKPAAPPPSMAKAPRAGGGETLSPGTAFDQLFGG